MITVTICESCKKIIKEENYHRIYDPFVGYGDVCTPCYKKIIKKEEKFCKFSENDMCSMGDTACDDFENAMYAEEESEY